jgi:hypothetical protein
MKTSENSGNENLNEQAGTTKRPGTDTGSTGSSHAEDWETDAYSGNEHDIKSEFEIRRQTKGSRGGTDEFNAEESHWDRSGSGPDTDDNNSGNGYRESDNGLDETMGVP